MFDSSKIPECLRIDVGFREEAFDFVLKFHEIGTFAANPWVVYDRTLKPNPWKHRNVRRFHPKWEELRLNENEYRVRVEIEAINLGKRQVAQYRLQITGPNVGDLQVTRLE